MHNLYTVYFPSFHFCQVQNPKMDSPKYLPFLLYLPFSQIATFKSAKDARFSGFFRHRCRRHLILPRLRPPPDPRPRDHSASRHGFSGQGSQPSLFKEGSDFKGN